MASMVRSSALRRSHGGSFALPAISPVEPLRLPEVRRVTSQPLVTRRPVARPAAAAGPLESAVGRATELATGLSVGVPFGLTLGLIACTALVAR